jgi:hypothetical protein
MAQMRDVDAWIERYWMSGKTIREIAVLLGLTLYRVRRQVLPAEETTYEASRRRAARGWTTQQEMALLGIKRPAASMRRAGVDLRGLAVSVGGRVLPSGPTGLESLRRTLAREALRVHGDAAGAAQALGCSERQVLDFAAPAGGRDEGAEV